MERPYLARGTSSFIENHLNESASLSLSLIRDPSLLLSSLRSSTRNSMRAKQQKYYAVFHSVQLRIPRVSIPIEGGEKLGRPCILRPTPRNANAIRLIKARTRRIVDGSTVDTRSVHR